MNTREAIPTIALLAVILIALAVTFNSGQDRNSFANSWREVPQDNFNKKGLFSIPIFEEILLSPSTVDSSSHDTSLFRTEDALARPTWKFIVFNQFDGTGSKHDQKLLAWLKRFKEAAGSIDVLVEIWFVRLSDSYPETAWHGGLLTDMCGTTGSGCFDNYLMFKAQAEGRTLENDYLNSVAPECNRPVEIKARLLVVVGPDAERRFTYSDCSYGVNMARVLKSFAAAAGNDISHALPFEQATLGEMPGKRAIKPKSWD